MDEGPKSRGKRGIEIESEKKTRFSKCRLFGLQLSRSMSTSKVCSAIQGSARRPICVARSSRSASGFAEPRGWADRESERMRARERRSASGTRRATSVHPRVGAEGASRNHGSRGLWESQPEPGLVSYIVTRSDALWEFIRCQCKSVPTASSTDGDTCCCEPFGFTESLPDKYIASEGPSQKRPGRTIRHDDPALRSCRPCGRQSRGTAGPRPPGPCPAARTARRARSPRTRPT